jgi:hypothetical protein
MQLSGDRQRDLQLNSWRMPSPGMLPRVVLVRTDVSEKRSVSIVIVARIGELETTLAFISNRNTLGYIPLKCRSLQEPHGLTSQKTALFIVTAVKTSSLADIMKTMITFPLLQTNKVLVFTENYSLLERTAQFGGKYKSQSKCSRNRDIAL